MKISTVARTTGCDAFVDLIDAGAGAGTLGLRSGSAPTNTTDANSGTLAATCTFSDPAFGAASSGVATANAITSDTSIDATATVAHFRIYDSNALCICQGTVGTSGTDLVFNSVDFTSGGTAAISSLTNTVPAGS